MGWNPFKTKSANAAEVKVPAAVQTAEFSKHYGGPQWIKSQMEIEEKDDVAEMLGVEACAKEIVGVYGELRRARSLLHDKDRREVDVPTKSIIQRAGVLAGSLIRIRTRLRGLSKVGGSSPLDLKIRRERAAFLNEIIQTGGTKETPSNAIDGIIKMYNGWLVALREGNVVGIKQAGAPFIYLIM